MIIIPGHETIIPNRLYTSRLTSAHHHKLYSLDGSEEKMAEAFLMERYRVPSKEKTLEYLKNTAQTLIKTNNPNNLLDTMLLELDKSLIEEYSKENSPQRDILRNYINPEPKFAGSEYLHVLTAILLDKDLKIIESKAKGNSSIKPYKLYITLVRRSEEHYQTEIRLKEGILPSIQEMDQNLANKVLLSGAMSTSASFSEYRAVEAQIGKLYAGITRPNQMSLVPDTTNEFIEEILMEALSESHPVHKKGTGQRERLIRMFLNSEAENIDREIEIRGMRKDQ